MNIMLDDNMALIVLVTFIVFFIDEVESLVLKDPLRNLSGGKYIYVTTSLRFGMFDGLPQHLGTKAFSTTLSTHSQGQAKVNLSVIVHTLVKAIDVGVSQVFNELDHLQHFPDFGWEQKWWQS